MTVAECIALLQKLNPRAHVVINGIVPRTIIPLSGKVIEGYLGLGFRENPHGNPDVRYQGVTFTHLTEQSDGAVIATHHF